MSQTGQIFNIQKFSINDGPGIRTTVFFKGCPLACRWCANPESQNRYAAQAQLLDDDRCRCREVTVEEVMAEVLQDKAFYDQSGGGMTLSGGEGLQQVEFAAAMCRAARAEGIHTAAETTGFAPPERFRLLLDEVDLLLLDVKHSDPAVHRAGTGVDNRLILDNLRTAAVSGKDIIARIPVIPRFNSGPEDARRLAALLTDLKVHEVHLLPFHQFGERKYQQMGVPYDYDGVEQLHPEDLEDYRQIFLDAGLDCTFR